MTPAALFLPLALAAGAAAPPQAPQGAMPGAVCDRDGSGNLLPGQREYFWPEVHPVWAFCAVRPANSGGTNGSHLELYNVRFRDHLVLKRAHSPILNVNYLPGGCGGSNHCYRDWSDEERSFQADNVVAPGFSEPTAPATTVCEHPRTDIGSFAGVAAENRDNQELLLSSQTSAGWYRYIARWRFFADGRMTGSFSFAAVNSSCIQFTHTHHNYWRLDFDIDGPENDYIFQSRPAGKPAVVGVEGKTLRGPEYWIVRDGLAGRGYKLTPGASVAADAFANSDLWFLRYKPSEIDDSIPSLSTCPIQIDPFINGESLRGQDVVVWLRGGGFHQGGDFDHCGTVDFNLEPVGDW
ncbi:MAG TPA: hypothetical protein VF310_01150 [Vicinamibacteria bacterium]